MASDEPAGQGTKMFQIYEPDLVDLERILPELCWDMFEVLCNEQVAPRIRTKLRRCQKILSDVRWNYGPPEKCGIITGNDLDETEPANDN